MNTPVSFELAKLLIQKSYDLHPDFKDSYPTIAEVVMWLYEKHGIWIVPLPTPTKHFVFGIYIIEKPYELVNGEMKKSFNSPTEAYEAAIEHTFKNLI
jgi:hypothetical protein